MNNTKLPKGWWCEDLGNICDLTIGKTPSRKRSDYWMNGVYPWVTIGDMDSGRILTSTKELITQKAVQETGIPLIPRGTVLLSFKLSIGKVAVAGTDLYTNEAIAAIVPRSEQVVLRDYLFFYLQNLDIVGQARQVVKGKTVNKTILLKMPVIVPPLPVQERIVQILQKADEIRRKRREALEIVEAIRRSLFAEMFGDPGSNPKGWPVAPLNDLLDPAIERVNPASAFPQSEFTYIEIAGVKNFRIMEVKRLLGAEAPSRARQVVRTGDVLYSMTRPNLRNIAVVPEAYDGAICTTGFAILRPRNPDDSAFVFEIVKSDHFTEAMSRLAEAKSLYPAVDEDQVRRFQIIHPPAPARAHFGRTINKLFEVYSKLHTGTEIGQAVFSSLLSRAFTGELTAEWEAANAEEIAKQQAFHERLPRLLVLALVAQKAKRASRAAAEVLVTALMKYVFLLQMEGNSGRRRLYHFVPYHYGPFAKELYADLKKLQAEGLVTVDNDSEEEKTRIALADPGKAEQALAELPDDLKEDVAAVIEKYGRLDHNALLTAVYEKYPAYARKSRLKRRTRGS